MALQLEADRPLHLALAAPGAFAVAEEISVPSIRAGDSRYFWPWRVAGHQRDVGSSTTGVFEGQVNAL